MNTYIPQDTSTIVPQLCPILLPRVISLQGHVRAWPTAPSTLSLLSLQQRLSSRHTSLSAWLGG